MDLVIQPTSSTPELRRVEVVERKGLGHPDTLCDAIAERICVSLSRYYVDRFGMILHHNVDKVLLCGGSSRPCFGGGDILEPMELYLAGRATCEWRGERIPVHDLAVAACREVLKQRLPDIDLDRHVRVVSRLRPGSTDLTRLFGVSNRMPLANDTSCGAGFAPLSDLERAVLEVEHRLNSAASKREHPYIGSDIKVMGVRNDRRITLTIGCAFIARHVADLDDYVAKKDLVRAMARAAARCVTPLEVDATVNAADDIAAREAFLTVTGTSAEGGDDGEVGRGNRTNGLITPYRKMTIEAAAGKNPVSHIGKLYSVVADRVSAKVARDVPGVRNASCVLVSQIGRPIDDPQIVEVGLGIDDSAPFDAIRTSVHDIVCSQLAGLPDLTRDIVAERVGLY